MRSPDSLGGHSRFSPLTDEQQAAGVMACAAIGCVALATVALLALLAWALWG